MEHRGRIGQGRDVTLVLGDDMIAALDAYRDELDRQQPGLRPSRSAAARVLLREALAAERVK